MGRVGAYNVRQPEHAQSRSTLLAVARSSQHRGSARPARGRPPPWGLSGISTTRLLPEKLDARRVVPSPADLPVEER